MASTRTSDTEMEHDADELEAKALRARIGANNALPSFDTLKYLARALRKDNAPETTLNAMINRLEEQYLEPIPTHALSGANTVPEIHESRLTQTSKLLQLPIELIGLIKAMLDPADVVCLAQTCTELRGTLDCSLSDLKRFCLAAIIYQGEPSEIKIRDIVFQATERLDRDRLARLKEDCRDGMLVCHVCVKVHPAHYFSDQQRGLPAGQNRRCIASQRPIRVCESWTESFESLRYVRRACMTAVGDPTTWSPPSGCHRQPIHHDGHLPACLDDCMLFINSRHELVASREITIATKLMVGGTANAAIVRMVASGHGCHVRLCRHLKLGDEQVMDVFEDKMVNTAEYRGCGKPGRCSLCRTSWWFGVGEQRDYSQPAGRALRCVLNVRQLLGDLKDPWDERYLALTEGRREQHVGSYMG